VVDEPTAIMLAGVSPRTWDRHNWQGPKATNSMAFAWMVWDANHRGPWTGKRIAWRPL
jgi:hypothetical protein